MNIMANNPPDIETLWQAHRDGELDAAGLETLKAHLAAHPHAARVFEAESQWLDALHDDDPPMSGGGADADAFKRGVVEAWATPQTVGFIGRYGSALVAAASIALIAGLMWIASSAGPVGAPDPIAEGPDDAPVQPAVADRRDGVTSPVSRFVLSVSGAFDRQPAVFRKNLDNAADAIGVNDLMKIFPQQPAPGTPGTPGTPRTPQAPARNDETRS